jgi:predicted CXXCH cytochrome family protein
MKGNCFRSRSPVLALLIAFLAGVGLVFILNQPHTVQASSTLPQQATPLPKSDAACLSCHSKAGQAIPIGGESTSITIDQTAWDKSVHSGRMTCTDCHTTITSYPHPKLPDTVKTKREFVLLYKDTCKNCHAGEANQLTDSAHTALLKAGNENAPVCSDCHNPHTQVSIQKDQYAQPAPSEKANIAKICSNCHLGIYQEYQTSVHGAALTAKNTDVPVCTDCHGIHKVTDARSNLFRNSSIQLCANCHTDAKLMSKYNLSTDVLNTYVTDFHGTTTVMFEKQSPDEQTNKPVCYDCHGVHNIAKANDPKNGLAIKENLLLTCKKCHPDANVNFPDSWMSHYIPSPTRDPLVFYVNGFYWWFFIPVLIGGMLFFVITDLVRRQIDRRKKIAEIRSK